MTSKKRRHFRSKMIEAARHEPRPDPDPEPPTNETSASRRSGTGSPGLKPMLPSRNRKKCGEHQQVVTEPQLARGIREEPVLPGAQHIDGYDDDSDLALVDERGVDCEETVDTSHQTTYTPTFDWAAQAVMIDEPVVATSVDICDPERPENNEETRGFNRRKALLLFLASLIVGGATTGVLVYFLTKPKVPPPTPSPTPSPTTSPTPSPTPAGLADSLEAFIRSKSSSVGSDSPSPQPQAFDWLTKDPYTLGAWFKGDKRGVLQRFALATLWFATGGDRSWHDGSEWLGRGPECEWHSYVDDKDLSCNSQGTLHAVTLWGDGLSGTIPNEIGLLSDLLFLDLYNNALGGTLPTEIGLLKELRVLTIADNNLEGPIPTELEELTKLERLVVNGNELTGFISSSMCETLKEIEPGWGITCDCCVAAEPCPNCFCPDCYVGSPAQHEVGLLKIGLWFETRETTLQGPSVLEFRSSTEEYIETHFQDGAEEELIFDLTVDIGAVDVLSPMEGLLGLAFHIRVAFQWSTDVVATVHELVEAAFDSEDDIKNYLSLLENSTDPNSIFDPTTDLKRVHINDIEVFSSEPPEIAPTRTEAITETDGSPALLIILVSVGVGLLLGLTAGFFYCHRQRKKGFNQEEAATSTGLEPAKGNDEVSTEKKL